MNADMPLQPELIGERLTLRPLAPTDWDDLYGLAKDPLVWEQHPARDRWQEGIFRPYFEANLASAATLVAELADGQVIGWSRYCRDYVEPDEIEIGWTMLGRPWWGGSFNGEMKALMLKHAFRHVDRAIFRIGLDNWRSRKAAEKIGAYLTDRIWPAGGGLTSAHVGYAIDRPG